MVNLQARALKRNEISIDSNKRVEELLGSFMHAVYCFGVQAATAFGPAATGKGV
jgi:hypothetical protein